MFHNGNMFVLGDEKAILLQQKGDGTLIFYVTARHPENWVKTCGIDFDNNKQVCDFLLQFFEGWNPVFQTSFNASEEFLPRLLYGTPIDQQWQPKPNLTIIGDAAQLCRPLQELA